MMWLMRKIGVVDARSQVIGRHFRLTQQREIFDLVGELGLRAVDAVGKAQLAAFAAGDPIAQGKWLAGSGAAIALFARQLAHAGIEEPRALRRD